MDDTIYFHIPSFTSHKKLNMLLLLLMHDEPDLFYPNIKIGSIYDSFPNAAWNGGRIMLGAPYIYEQIEETYRTFNEMGVPLRHTFTNNSLEEFDVYDRYCNGIMELGNTGFNQVLVNSPILESYIREKYPNYPIISSTTKRLVDIEDLNKELANPDYHMVVLDYVLNRNPRIFTLENKERLELLVDAYCCDGCTKRADHYKHMSEVQLGAISCTADSAERMSGFSCMHIAQDFYTVISSRKSAIKVEELYGFYYQMGFRNFKIEGRTNSPADVLESYMYYMVKPEYRDHARLLILRQYLTPDQPGMVMLTQEEVEEIEKNRLAKSLN